VSVPGIGRSVIGFLSMADQAKSGGTLRPNLMTRQCCEDAVGRDRPECPVYSSSAQGWGDPLSTVQKKGSALTP
jgi:hypothetical protein